MAYKYYQPNKLDLKDETGDCSIRALSKCFECTWQEAFLKTVPPVVKYQVLFNDTSAKHLNKVYEAIGLTYKGLSTKDGSRMTVADFARSTRGDGKHYIAKVRHHFVAVYDGDYFDTWDSGTQKLYGYYTRN